MGKRYVLRYGDNFANMRLWEQFQTVIDGTHGRRNLLIFRIITALICELGINDYDEYSMITVIEKWACERLSADHPLPEKSTNHNTVPDAYPPAPAPEPDQAPSVRSPDTPANVPATVSEKSETNNTIPFDTSMFGGMNRNSKLSDL